MKSGIVIDMKIYKIKLNWQFCKVILKNIHAKRQID